MRFAPYRARFADVEIAKELDFDPAEYQRRLAAVQAEMAVRGLDLLVAANISDICWLTGFQTPSASTFAVLAVPAAGDPVLQIIDHEYACARRTSWLGDAGIRSFPWYEPATGTAQHLALIEELAPGMSARIALEARNPVPREAIAGRLAALGRRIDWAAAESLIVQIRRVKSPAEIEAMRESGRIARVALNDTLAMLRPGLSDSDIAAFLMKRMIEEGSEFPAMGPFVATGLGSSIIHTTWKRRPVTAGEHVFLEPGPSYKRYNAPMMRTAIMGRPSPLAERLTAAVEDTLGRLLSSIRAGATGHEVAVAAAKGFAPILDEIYFQGAFGYGVGLALPSDWAEGSTPYIAEGIEEPLAAGMTLHLPVAARVVGFGGVALSETVLVTERGCESLTAQSRSVVSVPA